MADNASPCELSLVFVAGVVTVLLFTIVVDFSRRSISNSQMAGTVLQRWMKKQRQNLQSAYKNMNVIEPILTGIRFRMMR